MAETIRTAATRTSVRHVAKPMGVGRSNGPHLADLREFVRECEGLPDDLVVRIDKGNLDEGGRRDVTFQVDHVVPFDLQGAQHG